MKRRSRFARSQRMAIASGILFLVVIIIILQLWLFTATMNAFLGGDTAILLPAALASLVCLGLNGGLLWYLYGLEK
ncbi:MAG: hypothetical protein H6636_10585 [Anaerolineales bacterium]|jgi:hypothetical protein|nr:hypothetical protein [Anaerolineales bacterium]